MVICGWHTDSRENPTSFGTVWVCQDPAVLLPPPTSQSMNKAPVFRREQNLLFSWLFFLTSKGRQGLELELPSCFRLAEWLTGACLSHYVPILQPCSLNPGSGGSRPTMSRRINHREVNNIHGRRLGAGRTSAGGLFLVLNNLLLIQATRSVPHGRVGGPWNTMFPQCNV